MAAGDLRGPHAGGLHRFDLRQHGQQAAGSKPASASGSSSRESGSQALCVSSGHQALDHSHSLKTMEHAQRLTWVMTSCMSPSAAPPRPAGALHSTAQRFCSTQEQHRSPHNPGGTGQKGGKQQAAPALHAAEQLTGGTPASRPRPCAPSCPAAVSRQCRCLRPHCTAAGQQQQQQGEDRVVKDSGGS